MKTEKAIKTRDAGSASDLLCPRCGADNLHHGDVEVFDRSEDEEQILKTVATGHSAQLTSVPNAGSGNPSARRHGLRIGFSCEQCGDEPMYLTIAQHKGSTEIGWQYAPAKTTDARYSGDPEFGRF